MAPRAGPVLGPAPAHSPSREEPREAPRGKHGACVRAGQRGHLVRSSPELVPAPRSRWVGGAVPSEAVAGPGSPSSAWVRRGVGWDPVVKRGRGHRRGYDSGVHGRRTPSLSGHPPSRSRNPLVAPLGGLSSASAAAATEGFRNRRRVRGQKLWFKKKL